MRQAAWGAHRRLAVVIGLWVVVQSLTGLVLLFADPIEHWTHPGLTDHGKGDLGAAAALDAVHRRYPAEELGVLATPAVSDGVYVVEVGEREAYVDPARAHINGLRNEDGGFLALVHRIHRRFLFDSIFGLSGVRLVALLGAAWLVLALAGLTTGAAGRVGRWWQRGVETGRWWRTLPAGARCTPHVLHRTIGFVVVAPMVLVVVTGIRLAVPAGSDRIWA
ncbi:MAG: PepSY domain-containing protein, partial [Actinobacteria bacterium]|nr:PepSY domain-containing protein [Actinomycetota bacterium]